MIIRTLLMAVIRLNLVVRIARFVGLFFTLSLQRTQVVYYSSKIQKTNPSVVSDVTLSVFNGSDGVSRFNFTVRSSVDLPRPNFYLTVMTRSEGSATFDELYHTSSIGICSQAVSKGVFANFIITTVAKTLESHSNFRFECPLRKKLYYINEYPALDLSLLKLFSMTVEDRKPEFEFTLMVKAKPRGRKSVEHILTANLYGQVFL